MRESKRTVQLDQREIEFIRTSLDYSIKRLRDRAIDPLEDRDMALARRREQEELVSAIKQAMR